MTVQPIAVFREMEQGALAALYEYLTTAATKYGHTPEVVNAAFERLMGHKIEDIEVPSNTDGSPSLAQSITLVTEQIHQFRAPVPHANTDEGHDWNRTFREAWVTLNPPAPFVCD